MFKFLAPNQPNFPLIQETPGLWTVDMTNAQYLGFWDQYEVGDEYHLKNREEQKLIREKYDLN